MIYFLLSLACSQLIIQPLELLDSRLTFKIDSNIYFQQLKSKPYCHIASGTYCKIIQNGELQNFYIPQNISDFKMALSNFVSFYLYYPKIQQLLDQLQIKKKDQIFYESKIRQINDEKLFYEEKESNVPTKIIFDFDAFSLKNQNSLFPMTYLMDPDSKILAFGEEIVQTSANQIVITFTNFYLANDEESKKQTNLKYSPERNYIYTKTEVGRIAFSQEVSLVQYYLKSKDWRIRLISYLRGSQIYSDQTPFKIDSWVNQTFFIIFQENLWQNHDQFHYY